MKPRFIILFFLLISYSIIQASNVQVPDQPVLFRENRGQLLNTKQEPVKDVFYIADAPALTILLTTSGITYLFREIEENEEPEGMFGKEEKFKIDYEKLHLILKNASIKAENIIASQSSETVYNYFSAKGMIRNVKEYKKITVLEVYPGIDWVLTCGEKNGLKYDFILHPGADASKILLQYDSPRPVKLQNGELRTSTKLGELREQAPYSYLSVSKKFVASSFHMLNNHRENGRHITVAGFQIQTPIGLTEDLVIDPHLTWSSVYGGSGFEGTMCADVSPTGNLLFAGYKVSSNFPLLNSGTFFSTTGSGFILKFSPTGTLLWATTIDGIGNNCITGMDHDAQGNLFICGDAGATGGVPVFNNATFFQAATAGGADAYIIKFDNLGNIVWGTYFGGSMQESGRDLACDPSGNVFMCGTTTSSVIPLQNAGTYYQSQPGTGFPNGFISKFSNSGQLLWSTYYNNVWPQAIATDVGGGVTMTGYTSGTIQTQDPGSGAYFQAATGGTVDVFIAKFTNTGNLSWATYYGGTNTDRAYSIITDKYANIFVTGQTNSYNLPVMNAGGYYQPGYSSSTTGISDVFILKFNSAGVRQWATYYGGTASEDISVNDNLALDSCGNFYCGFETSSSNIALMQSCDGGFFKSSGTAKDIFITRFDSTTALSWATYLGGNGINDFRSSLEIVAGNHLYVTGEWTPPASTQGTGYTFVPWSTAYMDSTFNGSEDLVFARFSPNTNVPSSFNYGASYCVGDSTTKSPTLGSGWSGGGIFSAAAGLKIDSATGKVSPSLSLPGTHTVTYMPMACKCSTAFPLQTTVNILPAPSLSVSPSSTICAGASVIKTAGGATGYTWTTGAQTATVQLVPLVTTQYTVTGASAEGCKASAVMKVSVIICTALKEVQQLSQLRVFPNPNNGSFMIENPKDKSLELISDQGQLLRNWNSKSENHSIFSVDDLAPGIYFIRFSGEENALKVVVGSR